MAVVSNKLSSLEKARLMELRRLGYDVLTSYDAGQANQGIPDEDVLRLPPKKNKQLSMENNLLQRITLNPEICHGKLCIRGLRYPVEFILELLSSGMTTDDILEDYDDLEPADILAVLAFATGLTQVKSIYL